MLNIEFASKRYNINIKDNLNFPVEHRKGLWLLYEIINNDEIEVDRFRVLPMTKKMIMPHEFDTAYTKKDIENFFPTIEAFLDWFPSENFGSWIVDAKIDGEDIMISGNERQGAIALNSDDSPDAPDFVPKLSRIMTGIEQSLNRYDTEAYRTEV